MNTTSVVARASSSFQSVITTLTGMWRCSPLGFQSSQAARIASAPSKTPIPGTSSTASGV
jgi:hypothetical protein